MAGPLPTPPPSQTVDEFLEDLNRSPLFMTSLDETDGSGNSNPQLDALKALAYEGTKSEVASNFRDQGNECARAKHWSDAREFYDKGIGVLHDTIKRVPAQEETPELAWTADARPVTDLDEEAALERSLEETLLANRAAAHLELRNFGAASRDALATLRLNPKNVKAYYRLSRALFALDKLDPARQALAHCLTLDNSNTAAQALGTRIAARTGVLARQVAAREAELAHERRVAQTLQLALKAKGIVTRTTGAAPAKELKDGGAVVQLTEWENVRSAISVPVLVLYPTAGQSELIKGFVETENMAEHLKYILPVPWPEGEEFGGPDGAGVECFAEKNDGGLVKLGKKVTLGKLLGGGNVEIRDGMVRVYVVPKDKVEGWIEEVKKRRVKQ